MRNHGAYLLAKVGKPQTVLSRELGVSAVTMNHYYKSVSKPNADRRKRAFKLYGIPVESWDQPCAPDAFKPSEPIPGIGALGMARELEQMARKQIDDLRSDEKATPLERARVMASLAGSLNILAKLTGQYDLNRMLFKLPAWKQVIAAHKEALEDYPEAAEALAERLQRIIDEAEAE